jgi:hypothetical protein
MPSRDLPENIDAQYADDASRPDVEIHQHHHDVIHDFVNIFDDGTPNDGDMFFFDGPSGLWTAFDPLDGIPGTQGKEGHGIIYRGDWDALTSYVVYNGTTIFTDDVVQHLGNTYIALVANAGDEPQVDVDGHGIASTNWGVMTVGGKDGVDGERGFDGAEGPQGDVGVPGPSSEAYDSIGNAAGLITLDCNDATMYEIVLADDILLTLADSSGVQANAITIRVVQGPDAPNTVTFDNVSAWITADGLPPDTATVEGDVNVYVFDRMPSMGWFGYAPGGVVTPVEPAFPTLDITDLTLATVTTDRDAPGGWTAVGSSVQIGDERGGIAAVVLTRNDSIAPVAPAFSGGGSSSWVLIKEVQQSTVASLRRALFLYATYDAVASAASAFDITLSDSSTGLAYTGMLMKVCRTTGKVPSTWPTVMAATAAGRTSDDSGENTSVIHCPLASPQIPENRGIVAFSSNQAVAGVGTTMTPEANWNLIGTEAGMTGPNQALWMMWNGTAFDTTPTVTPTAAGAWLAAGAELKQGV